MFLKVSKVKGHRYLRVAESYRDPETGKPKQRYLFQLGRADQLEAANVDNLINGLLRETGRPSIDEISRGIKSDNTTFLPARQLGDVWLLTQLWHELKFAQTIARAARKAGHYRLDFEQLVRVMVINRLSDPASKLGVLRWLETVHLPGVDRNQVTHQNLLRAMDALQEHKAVLESQLLGSLLPMFDDEMEVVFYDITTVHISGESRQDGEIRHYGPSKDKNGIARQVAVGVVQTADGIPVMHEVFEGNVSEAKTVRGIVEKLCERFPIRRLVLVADRGMLSMDNLAMLEDIRLPGGRPVEYIVAVPARRYTQLTRVISKYHPRLRREAKASGEEAIAEVRIDAEGNEVTEAQEDTGSGKSRRLVMAHSEEIAEQSRESRASKLRELAKLSETLIRRLDGQDQGEPQRGRKLTDQGAKLKFHQAIAQRRLGSVIQVDRDLAPFCWNWDWSGFRRQWQRDGKLILITNVPESDMDTATVVGRYKSLAAIERGFRVLKSQIEIAPVHHRLPNRIRAHAFICFLALVLHRVMDLRLKASKLNVSPARLIEKLKQVQYQEVRLANGQPLEGVSTLTPEQTDMFDAMGVPRPTRKRLEAAAA